MAHVASPPIDANQLAIKQAPPGHIIAIDILRGFAILWVVLFHLWEDIKLFPLVPIDYFNAFGTRLTHGEWSRLGTSFIDAFSRIGYQGVTLFMMLSGLSLYLSAARKGERVNPLKFYPSRFRKVLIPYWFGYVVMIVSVCVIALVQMQVHGTSFGFEYHHGSSIATIIPVDLGWSETFDSLTLVSRILYDDRLYIANGSLWFAVLILQYYLLFPFLYPLLGRIGPAAFVAGAFAFTIACKLILIAVVGSIAASPALRLNSTLAPFRVFEFALGMGVGYLMVHRRELLDEYLSTPMDIAGVVLLGLLLEIGGSSFDARTHYLAAFSTPMIILGLTLLSLPLLAKRPGRAEHNPIGALLAWTGVLSYPILITNEPIRLVASSLRIEEVPNAVWWLFLTAVYMPVTMLAARPLVGWLGLTSSVRSTRPHDAATPSVLAAEAAGGGG